MSSQHFSAQPFNPRAYNIQPLQQQQHQQQQQPQQHWHVQLHQQQFSENPNLAIRAEPFWGTSHGGGPPDHVEKTPADASLLQIEGAHALPRCRQSTGSVALDAVSALQTLAEKWKSLVTVRDGLRATNEDVAAGVLNAMIRELELQLGI